MASAFQIALPIPPSVNEQYVNRRYGNGGRGRLLSEKARKWKADAVLLVRSQANTQRYILSGPYIGMDVCFWFSTMLRRDRDNGLKIVQDAVCDGLGIRDSRVVTGNVSKRTTGIGEPSVCVYV